MLKDCLKKGEFVLGAWCEIPNPMVINVLARAGLDFVIIDMEHSVMDYKVAQEMVMAAQADGCEPLIRVAENSETSILRSLDTDAAGIVVPHIETYADKEKVIKYSKFAPIGNRGFNPFIRTFSYRGVDKKALEKKNDDVLICLILEGKECLENIEEIISDSQVDVVYIGTYDLSVALGVPGDVKNKIVVDTLEKMVRLIIGKGKVAGCMIHNNADLEYFRKIGIQFITFKADTAVLYDGFNEMVREFKND
jgi:4-hydroxy-2-oxoheptanedioate aldolase